MRWLSAASVSSVLGIPGASSWSPSSSRRAGSGFVTERQRDPRLRPSLGARHRTRGSTAMRLAIRRNSQHADRQRQRLHIAVHRRAQRLRIRPAAAGGPPKERVPRPPANAGQDRTLPPDAAALARRAAPRRERLQSSNTSSTLSRALQRAAPTPRAPAPNARPRVPRDPKPPCPQRHAPGHYRLRYDRLDTKAR